MISKLESTVPAGAEDLKAQIYIERAWPFIGKNRLKTLLKQKDIRINGKKATADHLVKAGDNICVYISGDYSFDIDVIYEDGFIVSFKKPAYLPIDADEYGIGDDTVLHRLKRRYANVQLVHRLDTATRGVMLAALNPDAYEYLTGLFRNHWLIKKYAATVVGKMPKTSGTLRNYLEKNPVISKVRVYDKPTPDSVYAETIYTVDKVFELNGTALSVITLEIPPGRTHQIRAQLAHIGHPLLGNDKYGDRSVNKALNAAAIDLCCREITIKDTPAAGKYAGMKFVCTE